MHDIQENPNGENVTKLQIFLTAARLFAKKGFNGVSMREISEQSNVSKPTIYYYFGSKEGIFKALLETGLNYGMEYSKKIAQADIPAKEKLIKLMQNRFLLCHEHPDFSKFFLMVFINWESLPFVDDFKKEISKHRNLVVNIFKEGIKSGEFGAGANPELATEIFGVVVEHFIRMQLKSKRKILTDKLAEEIVELLFRGLNE